MRGGNVTRFRWVLIGIMSGALLLSACAQQQTAQGMDSGASASTTGYVGAPGTPPPTKTLSVAQYGAFGYASEENYCHTARWVIGGTLLPEYANDPHPVAIRRGSKATLVETIHTDCSSHGGNDTVSYTHLTL